MLAGEIAQAENDLKQAKEADSANLKAAWADQWGADLLGQIATLRDALAKQQARIAHLESITGNVP